MERVALVTGAASGIGLALVTALAKRGARVYAADRDGDGASALATHLTGQGHSVEAVTLDVTDAEAFQQLIARIAERGPLHELYNNAGIGLAGELHAVTAADWRRVVEINLLGVANGIAAAYPLMIRQGFGHLINTASGAGLAPRPGMAPYAATKHAVIGLSTSLRAEAAAYGVKVSAACPGYVATQVMARAELRGVDRQKLTEAIPIRPMSAEDCAEAILRGVARNQAIIPISLYVKLDWWLYRMSPALSIRLAQWRAAAFRKAART